MYFNVFLNVFYVLCNNIFFVKYIKNILVNKYLNPLPKFKKFLTPSKNSKPTPSNFYRNQYYWSHLRPAWTFYSLLQASWFRYE